MASSCATIVISTAGTLGDVLPFVALGKALRDRGHRVVAAVNASLHPWFNQAGLETVPCGPLLRPDQARQPLMVPEDPSQPAAERRKWEPFLRDIPGQYRDLHAACAGADLLVGHSFHYPSFLMYDQCELPWVCVSFYPGQFTHSKYQPTSPPVPPATVHLLASSLIFSQPRLEKHPCLAVTGFWFGAGIEPDSEAPTPAQRRFVEQGEPLVLYLGSLTGPEAAASAVVHVQAARGLEKKLVIQTGWMDPRTIDLPGELRGEQVLVAGPLPHDWLFAHAEAIIHSGGIGATARALRHGKPMLVEPQRKDQFFHAAVVRDLRVGGAMHPRKLTAAGLARMLSEKICIAATKAKAAERAERLRADDGLGSACQVIEEQLTGSAASRRSWRAGYRRARKG